MNRLIFVAILPLFLFSNATLRADLIYAFENHTADQSGHTVTGTITTTDNAINDGILQAGEVVGWQWSVVGTNGASVSSTDTDATLTIAGDVTINGSEITLMQPNIMSEMTYGLEIGSNADGRLSWIRQEQFGTFDEYYQGANGWFTSSPVMSNTDPWLVATRVVGVPEPSSLVCLIVVGISLLRRKRNR